LAVPLTVKQGFFGASQCSVERQAMGKFYRMA